MGETLIFLTLNKEGKMLEDLKAHKGVNRNYLEFYEEANFIEKERPKIETIELLDIKDLEELAHMKWLKAQEIDASEFELLPEDKCNLCCPDNDKGEYKFEVTERIYCDDEVVDWIKRAD